jgi:hypothetical protein
MTTTAAPSASTNPAWPLSNGREASVGLSLKLVLSARLAAKPPIEIGSTEPSAPPHTTTSASPVRISRMPSPIACALAAQAVTVHQSGL